MSCMWSRDFSWKYFPVHNWYATLDEIDLLKEQCTIYRPEYIFRKSHVIKFIKSLTNFIYKNVSPIISFKFISCQKICK